MVARFLLADLEQNMFRGTIRQSDSVDPAHYYVFCDAERYRLFFGFDEPISPIRFRTTVLTDLYDITKDIKQAQAAAGHTTAAMTLKHYVKGRHERQNTASPIADVYGLAN